MARYIKSGSVTRVPEINSELEKIATAQTEFLSRSGEAPNEMLNTLDMNNNRITNLRTPVSATDAARLVDVTGEYDITVGIDETPVFDNVAEMTSTNLAVGQLVRCKRYYAGGELVEGLVYEVKASATVDNFIDHSNVNGTFSVLVVSGEIDLAQAGAKGNGSDIDSSALQACLSLGIRVTGKAGIYNSNTALSIESNTVLDVSKGAVISFSGGASAYVFDTASKENITINNLEVITPAGTAGFSSLRFVLCNNVTITNCKITKSGSIAVFFDSCTNSLIDNCNLSSNYTYGVEDRDGVNNKYTNCLFQNNGNTGVATSTGGRGITLWRTTDCKVTNCSFITNNEYGYRIFSVIADTLISDNNIVSNCYFEDNGKLDVYLYDESVDSSLVNNTTIANCKVKRTIDPSLSSSFSISGTNNIVSGCNVVKDGAFGAFTAYNLFKGVNCQVSDCFAENLSGFASYSSASNCLINDCFANGVAVAISSSTGGGGNTTKGNKFIHGGAGTSDVAINNFLFSGAEKETYIDNIFDGFHTGIAINEEAVTITGNISRNSTLGGLRNFGDSFVGQEIYNNLWDLTAPAILSAFDKRNNPLSRAIVYNTAFPTTLTWAVGDRCINPSPAVGQPKSWVCTVAGTSGTWVSEGNL